MAAAARVLLLLTAAALLAAPLPASARSAPACFAGRFVVQGGPPQVGLLPPDVIHLYGPRLSTSIGGWDAKLRASGRGTLVRARFDYGKRSSARAVVAIIPRRPGDPPLRMKARISSDCRVMQGVIRGGPGRVKQPFVAIDEATASRACLDLWRPVCGADGVTYSNACYAAEAGTTVAHESPCTSQCGTIVGLPCGEGELCEKPDATCRSADLGGVCVAIPEVCARRYDPVCGCDGLTYGNDCERRASLVNKAHDGACPGGV